MNTIFLDIDGVLNSNFWNDEHQKEISDGTLIDIKKIELLCSLVNEFSAKIILHSGWKYWFDEQLNPLRLEAKKLVEMLEEYNLEIDGVTPDFASEEIKKSKKFSLVKADEILAWVSDHPDVNWIVLDDLDLHNSVVSKRQVLTDSHIGLTKEDLEKARKLFMEMKGIS